jgi:hypothetical protein
MGIDKDTLSSLLRPRAAVAAERTLSKAASLGRTCGRARAAANELQCMKGLALFGHLRSAEIARLVWPGAAHGDQMAARTLARLDLSGHVLRRRNAFASTSWVLTRKGATWLELRGVRARHTLDLSSVGGSSFGHRSLASRFLIEQRLAGFDVAGEYRLGHGASALPFAIEPFCKHLGKASDGLYWRRSMNGNVDVWWTEVENAPKAMADVERVLAVAEHVGARLGPHARLAGLTVVADSSLNHAARLLRAAGRRWAHKDAGARALLEARVQVVLVDLRPPLVWAGHRTFTLHQLRREAI